MKDIQNEKDMREIPINKVGIRGVEYPITVLDKQRKQQQTVAKINMFVDLPHHFRGTHMSRFIEILHQYQGADFGGSYEEILREMQRRFQAENAHIEVSFPFFVEKEAPVSRQKGLMNYQCEFFADCFGSRYEFLLGVRVPVTSLCPCSKEISDFGAHNQRGIIHLQVRYTDFIWIEDLINIAENAASAPVYALLKRSDEKFVTEQAYLHPRFVEDIAREAALALQELENISAFQISVENMESIHNHSAYAFIEKYKEEST